MKAIFQALSLWAWTSRAVGWVTLQGPGGYEMGWNKLDPECPAFIRKAFKNKGGSHASLP
jgi:hypothetical protein